MESKWVRRNDPSMTKSLVSSSNHIHTHKVHSCRNNSDNRKRKESHMDAEEVGEYTEWGRGRSSEPYMARVDTFACCACERDREKAFAKQWSDRAAKKPKEERALHV